MKNEVKYHVGEKLRQIRERRGLTLKTVAEQAGVSESFISQIERNRVSPSLDTLMSIADILSTDMEFLFRELKQKKAVDLVRRDSASAIVTPAVTYRQLSVMQDQPDEHAIEAFLMDIQPGEEKGSYEYGHVGKEFGFIIGGSAQLVYNAEVHDLGSGDSIAFTSDIPHTLKNTGKDILRALWVITPPRGMFSEH